jgi:predicted dehydrogenase
MSEPSVLLVGLGRWGEKHLRVLRELGATVWVADVSPARLAWAVERGVEAAHAVADHRLALDHVDAVDVVTPADSHLAVAGACLRAGKHCFVEKPLALTVAESRELEAIASATGRVLQVGHIFRFHPVTAALREALDGDRIGAVRYVTGRFSGFKRPRTDVGVNHTDGIHYFDLFAFLLRRRATSVTAVQRDYLGRGLEDMSLTIVTYGDVPAIVEANYFVPGTHRECVIVGERGSLVADYGAGTVILHPGAHRRTGEAWEAIDGPAEELKTGGAEPLRAELHAFLEACRGSIAVPVPASDGVRAMEIVEAAARSARTGQAVSLA